MCQREKEKKKGKGIKESLSPIVWESDVELNLFLMLKYGLVSVTNNADATV